MPVPAYSAAAVRAAEQPHIDAGRGESLMRRAAAGLASACRRVLRASDGFVTGKRVVVLAGPGNNGGDALFAAANLARRGAHVTVVAPLGRLHPEALRTAHSAGVLLLEQPASGSDRPGSGTSDSHRPDSGEGTHPAAEAPVTDPYLVRAASQTARADLVLDGLLGTGARPRLDPPLRDLLRAWQDHADRLPGQRVVAVDVPTGVDATTGECGDVVVRADLTVTFGARKAGLHLPGGAEASGAVECVDIGLGLDLGHPLDLGPAPEPTSDLRPASDLGRTAGIRPTPALWLVDDGDLRDWPQPGPRDHKYTRGVLGVIAGSQQYPGAGVLTCLAAVNAGVGMLRVQGARAVQDAVLARAPEVVTAPGRVRAWSIGSGAPEPRDMMEFLGEAIGTNTPMVLDAGALALIPALLTAAGGGPAAGEQSPLPATTVLTPHAGELRELLSRIDDDAADLAREDVEADPVRWARRAAHLTGAVVLLKGHRTLVATPDGRLWAPTPGPPALATAGSGDVLAGLVGAALATGLRQGHDEGDASGAAAGLAALAVVLHNRAGREARSASAIAEAVAAELSAVRSQHADSAEGGPDAR